MRDLVMPPSAFGEGESLSDETSNSLSQGVVPAFHVTGLPGLLVDRAMRFFGKHGRVGR